MASSCQESNTCVLKVDGGVWCWGTNGDGQVDATTTSDKAVPVEVTKAVKDNIAVGVGHQYTCAHKRDDSWCWGRNTWGQLGNGSTTDSRTTLVKVTVFAP